MDTQKQPALSSGYVLQPLKYVTANAHTLHKAFRDLEHVESFVNWKPVKHNSGKKWLKMPVQPTNDTKSHMSLKNALVKCASVGLVCNEEHSIIALDIDGVPNNNPKLSKFLEDNPTYQERSPSGKPGRTRLVYRLFDLEDKKKLRPKVKVVPEGQENEIELFNSSKNYITLTGEICSEETEVQFIYTSDLLQHWPEFSRDHKKSKHSSSKASGFSHLSPQDRMSLTPIKVWLSVVPCAEDHKLCQKYMSTHGYSYYDFWLLGMMALHYTFGSHDGYLHAVEWSSKSADFDKEELTEKWRSLTNSPQYDGITERTYQSLFLECSISWPVVTKEKGKKVVSPVMNEISNFKAWLEYFSITICIDDITKVIFLKDKSHDKFPVEYYESKQAFYGSREGDLERLSSLMTFKTRELNFRPSDLVIQGHLKTIMNGISERGHINRFAEAIKDVPWDGKDRISIISQDIIQRDPEISAPTQEFQDVLVRKWLLSLARSFWSEELASAKFAESSCEGMLILSGQKGGINKSSFGLRLLPYEWRHLYVSTEPRFSGQHEDKDYRLKTYPKVIVDFDEAERILDNNDEAAIKNEVTTMEDTFRPPYGKSNQTYRRKYSIMASTNKTTLRIPREGARRMWWLNVKYVDTYALDDMDKYQLWSQIRYELSHFSGQRAPWLLTVEEISTLETYLQSHRSETSLQIQLEEIYDFSDPGYVDFKVNPVGPNQKELTDLDIIKNATKTISQISKDLNMPNGAALKNAIRDFVKARAPKRIVLGKYFIRNGVFTYNGRDRYYMPVLRNEEWDGINE